MIYKKSWKYIIIKDNYLFRVKSLKDFSNVKEGDIGGYIGGYHNLSQKGNCWIYNDAWVCENARVSENAVVCENVFVTGNAKVSGNTCVCNNNAGVFDNASDVL